MQAVGIEEEPAAIEHDAEVVADTLVKIHADRQAKSRREVHARRALCCRRRLKIVQASHGLDYSVGMKALLSVCVLLLLVACSKVNQENFARIQDGMTEQEVTGLLGKPAESSSVNVLGVSGTSSRWTSGDAVITVRFVNGKVALKTFDKASAAQK